MNLPKVLRDDLLVKMVEEQISQVIQVLDESKIKPTKAKVLKMGPEVSEEIVVGDEIMVNEYAGTELVFKGETYVVINECEALAVVI